jgi:SAM-dependent methyltransferase
MVAAMGIWEGVFAALYDPLMGRADRAGLAQERSAVVSTAAGRVLEIGAGTGRNLGLYPATGISRLVLSEPSAAMSVRLEQRLRGSREHAEVVVAGAEALPFGDGAFDCVVSTLVLCTVPDLPAALAEIRRVLAPGGRLLFVEHVRAESPAHAAWQDRLHDPWLAIGNGCHCNRDTVAAITAAGFELGQVKHGVLRHLGPLVRPLVRATAIR